MNRTRIEWTQWTWNPVTGCLSTPDQCAVQKHCYAKRTAKRLAGRCGYPPSPHEFEPTFHPERLEEPYKLKKPSKIFVCSMGELFGPWVPREWQEAVIRVARENPQHAFQFLTKFPEGYEYHLYPINAWLGVTITGKDDGHRWAEFIEATGAKAHYCFVSFEPLLGPVYYIGLDIVDWIIIGAQTNPERQPDPKWVEYVLESATALRIPIFIKDNLDYEPKRREWPKGG